MPRPDVDEIVTQGHGRLYLQFCGPSPTNELQYAGYSTQYLALEGVTRPVRGGVTPIRLPDPVRPKKTIIRGTSEEAADFVSATLRATERHGAIPFQWGPNDQPFNIYLPRGKCERLDDFDGWTDFVEIYSYSLVTEGDFGARTPTWDTDEMIDDSLSLVIGSAYMAGSISFGFKASDETNTEVAAATFGLTRGCSECGVNDRDGTKRWYAVTKPGVSSPGLLPELIWTADGGSTVNQSSITSFGATEQPLAIGIAGNYLIILGDGAYFYASLNKKTGQPGSFTKVTTGFNSLRKPTNFVVSNPREIFFTAADGWIYKSTNVTSGVTPILRGDATSEDLYDIWVEGDNILAVGDSGSIILSVNRGEAFGTAPTTPTSWGFRACQLLDENTWWVGTGAGHGNLYYTDNGGETWSEVDLPDSTAVDDILFTTDEVGFILYRTASVARLYSTINGGASWTSSDDDVQRRMVNFPTFAYGRTLSAPYNPGTVAANNILIAGKASGSNDGVIAVGTSPLR